VANALQPAKVKEVRVDMETMTAAVTVPDYQLSLAIGKEGQNARLAAKLTGCRVDIRSETQAAEESRAPRPSEPEAAPEPPAAAPEPPAAEAAPEPPAAAESPAAEAPAETSEEPVVDATDESAESSAEEPATA
jgi:N utilization substance protein A